MIKKTLLILPALLVILATGCKKHTTETGNSCISKLDFTKITYTNDVGQVLQNDPTDWTNDSSWCTEEYNLFKTSGLDLAGTDSTSVLIIEFPNPFSSMGIIALLRPIPCYVQAVIVNRSFQVLDTFNFPPVSGTVIRNFSVTDTVKYPKGNFYRLYYAAHSANHLFFFKGHGDLKVGQ